jgi:hypothetical protein
MVLRVVRHIIRNIGWRVAAGIKSNTAVTAAEVAHLRLPAAIVAGKLVHKDDGETTTGFFIIKLDVVARGCVGHNDAQEPLAARVMRAAFRVFTISMATVIGPTPPGTGVMADATLLTEAKSTSPTSL